MNKVIFVTNFLGNGGAARVITVIANYLVEKNYQVEIVSFLDGKDRYKINKNIKYNVIKCKSKNNKLLKIERIFKLREIIKQNKDAVIISFEYFVNMQTIIAKLFLKNKLIISERNDPARVGNNKKHLRNFLYRFADILVCQTNDAKNYFPKFIQKKAEVILNPIKNDLPEPWTGRRNKEIVNFCRLEKQKNLPLLIDAFEMVYKKHPDYKLVIYGDGVEENNLINYINSREMNSCVFLKHFEQNIHEKILKCAMFVSSSDYEGLSNSMLEAMAIGLPTIVTDCPCGGARMVIENNENGILVSTNDKEQLCAAIEKVLEDNVFAKKLSNNGKIVKQRLDKNKICMMWENLINQQK